MDQSLKGLRARVDNLRYWFVVKLTLERMPNHTNNADWLRQRRQIIDEDLCCNLDG